MDPTPQTAPAAQTGPDTDFDLRPGMTVEVLTMENRLTFVGKVESYRNGAVMIRETRGDELPPVLFNKEIKLRFFHSGGSLVLYGKICGSTSTIWKLDRLESRFVTEQRAFFRQRISPNTEGQCYRRPVHGKPGTRPAKCQILDVSAGGILISSKEEYQEGDYLSVTGVRLVAEESAFSFHCQVRRAGKRDMGMFRYGCQFETLSAKEQDRLLRAIFTVQREEIRNQKDRELLAGRS